MPSPKPKYKEVAEPSISANQLAQYLVAGPHARKRIITSARWQSTAVVARYKMARSAIAECLCDGAKSPSTAAKHRAAMVEKLDGSNHTAWAKADLEASVEALDRYTSTANSAGLNKLMCKPLVGNLPPLMIAGVRVRVTADALIERDNPKELNPDTGAIVTMIAKGENSGTKRKEQAKTAAVLVWLFAQKHLASAGQPSPKLCFSYDVFDGALVPAGSNITTRINNINAACEEIALAWPSATPPADLDS
jgi:hypothetical protein